jgi:hypothetical protein
MSEADATPWLLHERRWSPIEICGCSGTCPGAPTPRYGHGFTLASEPTSPHDEVELILFGGRENFPPPRSTGI